MKALVIVCIILFFIIGVLLNLLRVSYSRKKDKFEEEQKTKNELKEKIETGNNRTDFDASLDVLHQLSKK